MLLKLLNERGGKLLSGPDRVTFVIASLFTLLPLPYFWLPDFGSPVTSRNQGSFRSKRENPGNDVGSEDVVCFFFGGGRCGAGAVKYS